MGRPEGGRRYTRSVVAHWGNALNRTAIQLALVWLTIACVLAQNAGAAAGGVLCLGCSNVWGGLALSDAPCEGEASCCSAHEHEQHSQPAAPADDEHDCGCIDLTLSPINGTVAQPAVKLLITFAHIALPATFQVGESAGHLPVIHMPPREGPPPGRAFTPLARKTVLLI